MSTAQTPSHHRGIVKQVLSGDVVVIRGQPKGGPPPEKTMNFSNITAPKLARRANIGQESSTESRDEPWAWEAREFVRKKLIGKEIHFVIEGKLPSGREYGVVYLGKDSSSGENITESLISEGLAEVRRIGKLAEEQQRLIELEEQAKNAKKGKWGESPQQHVRDVKWNTEATMNFVDSFRGKPIKAVIEHVRDGSTVRGFLLPDFHYITLMISGVRCPMIRQGISDETAQPEPFAEEAKYFSESRLLQRDVEIILESVNNANFVGSVLHPNGNIAEILLKDGFARCVDWSMGFVTGGAEKLRAAERVAKEKRVRLWRDYAPSCPQITGKDKSFQGTVIEVVNADALLIKCHNQPAKKIFLASIRPPRSPENQPAEEKKEEGREKKQFRPLYDIPYMYEAREFLRKKLIGKSVHVTVDYIQPSNPNTKMPERACCTVTIGGQNVAEALVTKGLATVVRYRQDDDQRSSHYDELLAAETKAIKTAKGLHSKADKPIHRVADISTEHGRAKQFLPFLQRAGRTEAVVEFVASGSRFRVFVPKETCIITFLLAGISCPRPTRPGPSGQGQIEGEPWGEEAMNYTKEICMQREVEIEVESMDKGGNFIGWLYIDKKNLSLLLVENGFASVHFTAERSSYYNALCAAENGAKKQKQKIWANYVENKEEDTKIDQVERSVNYKKVVVTDVTSELQFYAQFVDQGPKLEALMEQLRQEFIDHPPLEGAYSPRRGDICAAKFTDNQWYRGKVEKISGNNVSIFYMDYGNREVTTAVRLAQLPTAFQHISGFAHQYALACVLLPNDTDYREEAVRAFSSDTQDRTLELNEEFKTSGLSSVTLRFADSKEDVVRGLISDGLLLVESRKERHLQQLVSDYKSAQETAKKSRLNLWRYGDFTEDDAKEFGYQR